MFENLRDAVSTFGKKVRNLGKGPAFAKWEDLPNEIQRNILVYAVADQDDAWKANQTYVNLSRTSRDMWDHLHAPKARANAMRDFKSNLDEGRAVAKTVLKDAFTDKAFSTRPVGWGGRTIQHEAAALTPILASCSPKERLGILKGISELHSGQRLAGYARMLQQAHLFPQNKVDEMVLYAEGLFKDSELDHANSYRAADVLAIGHDAVSPKVRDKTMNSVRKTIAADPEKRAIFAEEVAQANPSLLKHEEFRTLVHEEFANFESPSKGIAALASHIDKNDRSATDFIIDNSLRFFGVASADRDHDHNKNAAAAIAKVADGNVSPENKDRIEELRQSGKEGASELNAAFEGPRPVALPKNLTQPSPQELSDELDAYEGTTSSRRFQNTESRIRQVSLTENLAIAAEKHVNSARRALMDTERHPRER